MSSGKRIILDHNVQLVIRAYDLADRMTSESDVYGNTSTYAYDNAGNVVQSVDANGHITRYEYDAMNWRTAG